MGRHSLWYRLMGEWVNLALNVFFRKKVYIGKENIPMDKPIIFSPNHQAAFMDALVVVMGTLSKKQLSFMVRQDVFSGKVASFFLKSFKLFPAYRMRDGYETLSKNQETFEHCYKLLEAGEAMIIFPEANHGIPRRLRALKKGLMRIAFNAEEKNDYKLDVQIVPVGINYTDPENFGSDCVVIYGKPLNVSKYRAIYEENQAKGINAMKDDLMEAMRPLVIDIKDKEHYDEIEFLREVWCNEKLGRKAHPHKRFKEDKLLIEKTRKIQNKKDFYDNVEAYRKALKEVGLKDYMFATNYKRGSMFLKVICAFMLTPLALPGMVLNYVPFILPYKLAESKIKDEGFKSSIKAAVGLVLFPVWYLILYFAAMPFLGWLIALVIIPSSLISGWIALKWLRIVRRIPFEIQLGRLESSILEEIKSLRSGIIARLS